MMERGRKLGPYEILSAAGAGGMGEVYEARDTRLDRTVAVKVLPPHLTRDASARARFEREARAISQLSHPHICTLYDVHLRQGSGGQVGLDEDIDYIVMEYIEGETLADGLAKAAVPLERALEYGIQIADALDTAHRNGVVHRDLKPGNIMITTAGVKLLDFGLARVTTPPAGASVDSENQTAQKPLTDAGALLGTVQYMAPEQLEGRTADARSDVFAFGALLYEMVTGKKAFAGKSPASVISAILSAEPAPLRKLQPAVSRALDRLVQSCLVKDPERRRESVRDLGLALRQIRDTGLDDPVRPADKRRPALGWIAAGILLVALLASLLVPRPEPATTRWLSILPPAGVSLAANEAPEISPDGRHVAFVATDRSGDNTIWLRPLDAPESRRLAGTEGASHPFWSPDGRSLGFFAGGGLNTIGIEGGPVQRLCAVGNARGGSWGTDGTVVFAPNSESDLYTIPASGGEPEPVTRRAEGQISHRWPQFLPDGRRFLFMNFGDVRSSGISWSSVDSVSPQLVLPRPLTAQTVPGHLLYARDRALIAQPFDPSTLAFEGDPVPIATNLAYDSYNYRAFFSASNTGVLAYRTGEDVRRFVWLDRDGQELEELQGGVARFAGGRDPAISPDGRFVAAALFNLDIGNHDLWVFDLARGISTRLTTGPQISMFPVWSPDGDRLAFWTTQGGASGMYVIPAAGAATLMREGLVMPTSWSGDGKLIAYHSRSEKGDFDISGLRIDETGEATPLIGTSADERDAHFSPDGRWIAYTSDESGRHEVYVQPFPASDAKWRISSSGGYEPHWRGDGKELFYVAANGELMSVAVEADDELVAGAPQMLFVTSWTADNRLNTFLYDVTSDGERFLFAVECASPDIKIVLNWTAELDDK